MSFFAEAIAYRDRYGMNQLTSRGGVGDVSQNGSLFTMEYLICLMESDTATSIKVAELLRLWDVYDSLERFGLTYRTPDSTEGDSMDNTGAIAAWSGCFGAGILARRMKGHGEGVQCTGVDLIQDPVRNQKFYLLARLVTATQVLWRPWLWAAWIRSQFRPKFFWNNQRASQFCFWGWHGRSPGHLGFLDLAAQGYTTPFRWVGVLVGQFLGCFKETGDTDARKLPYVGWYFLTKHTGFFQRWFWKLAYKVWVRVLLKQYPEGMRDVYSIYYQDPNHPIRRYSKRYFGEKT